MVPITQGEADDTNMAEEIISIFGNNSVIHVIVIEDTVDSTRLPSTMFTNTANVVHEYRVQKTTEQLKQHAVQRKHDRDGVTLIKLDSWSRLSFNGAGLFPKTCEGTISIIQKY